MLLTLCHVFLVLSISMRATAQGRRASKEAGESYIGFPTEHCCYHKSSTVLMFPKILTAQSIQPENLIKYFIFGIETCFLHANLRYIGGLDKSDYCVTQYSNLTKRLLKLRPCLENSAVPQNHKLQKYWNTSVSN